MFSESCRQRRSKKRDNRSDTGKLKYGEEERIYMRSANLFPPKLKGDEKIVAQLAGQVAEKEKEHPEQNR